MHHWTLNSIIINHWFQAKGKDHEQFESLLVCTKVQIEYIAQQFLPSEVVKVDTLTASKNG